jgi:hypothetical protein
VTILAKLLIRVVSLLALVAPAAALHAQEPASSLSPVEPTAVVAAARSCHAAITPERLDEARLTADGWSGGDVRSNGERVDTPLRLFSRDSILLFAVPDSRGCVVTARLRSQRGFAQVIEELTAAFGQPARNRANSYVWVFQDGRGLQVDATGNRRRPAIRIAIMHFGANSSGTPK